MLFLVLYVIADEIMFIARWDSFVRVPLECKKLQIDLIELHISVSTKLSSLLLKIFVYIISFAFLISWFFITSLFPAASVKTVRLGSVNKLHVYSIDSLKPKEV